MPTVERSVSITGVVVVTADVHGDERGRLVGLHLHRHQADYW